MSIRDRVSGVAKTEPPPPPETPAFSSSAWIGRVIDGRYQIESLLGEGGMGAVFLAEHQKLQKKVALKVILPQFAGDGEMAERFAREAMASAKLDHPHVASALDYGALPEGGAYLVMPFVRGRSLRRAIEAGADWRFACEIGWQIADALAAAHEHRIVHRDLKPENVILEPRGDGSENVKVLDFGVARVASEGGEGAVPAKALTRVGTIIGTPGYMAPEQALGEAVDARADLYALGVVLWEIVARRTLFAEDDLTAIVTTQLTTAPPRASSIVADVPPELDELIAKLLATKRDDRPEKAGDVRDLLKRLALGATLERKMLSGEIAVPQEITGSARVVAPTAPTIASGTHAAPSIAIPPALQQAAGALAGSVEIGSVRVPRGVLAVGCAAPLALATVVFFLALLMGGGEDPPAPVASDPAPVAVPETQRGRRQRAPEPPRGEDPPAARTPAEGGAIPGAIAVDVETVLTGDRRDDREAAAERIRAAALSDAPPFVAAVVDLELADRCSDREAAVVRLGEILDPRALPALERLERARRGCGFLGSQDCHRCLRRELRPVLEALRGE